jgi:enoyl-CoA hydratase/carnithine racemase
VNWLSFPVQDESASSQSITRPSNALSPGVPEDILAAVQKAQSDDSVAALVLIGAGRTFIAGADIKEFGKITSGERKSELGLAEMISQMEDSVKPSCARSTEQRSRRALKLQWARITASRWLRRK